MDSDRAYDTRCLPRGHWRLTRDPRPLVLIDARPARRRPVSGTATFVRELRRAIEEIAPTDIRLRWLSGPPGVPRRGRLTSAANAALDLGWTHVGLPVLALTLRAQLIHGTFHWTPWFSPVPTSVVIHDLMWEHFPDETDPRFRRFATRFTRRSARRAKLVLVPSKATSADLTERYGTHPDHIRVIPEGVRPARASSNEREPFILAVGIDEPRKRIAALVAAHGRYWSRAASDPARCRLMLVGAAQTGETFQGDGVDVLGRVSDDHLAELYQRATLLVYPSALEGFGLPILEAMAHGCPVLCARNAALVEVGADVALYLDDVATEPFARRLTAVLGDRDALATRGEEGRARAATFPWRTTALSTLDAFRELVY